MLRNVTRFLGTAALLASVFCVGGDVLANDAKELGKLALDAKLVKSLDKELVLQKGLNDLSF